MGMVSSMQYTIGTALDRARQAGHVVEVLVDGQWLGGLVVANDGTGVVLERDAHEHSVVRLESISAVRVESSAPMRESIAAGPSSAARPFDGPIVMPAPRSASA